MTSIDLLLTPVKNILTCNATQCSFLVFSGPSTGRSQDLECEVHLNGF